MLLDYFDGNLSFYGVVSRIMGMANVGSYAYNFFSNFVSNVITLVLLLNFVSVFIVFLLSYIGLGIPFRYNNRQFKNRKSKHNI